MKLLQDYVDSVAKLIDPSEVHRPEAKDKEQFRKYSYDEDDYIQARVRRTYHHMHTYQTVEFVENKIAEWTKFDKFEATIMEALDMLNNVIDESDPDVDVPNIVHAFQTAEKLREKFPDLDWLHLTGLIHDLGKVMAMYGEPHWAVVGDTFVVGCDPPQSVVYRSTSFEDNPDMKDSRYNTKYGMYHKNIGLRNVLMSWGHDYYLHQVLKHNNCSLPEEGLWIIRFHSFYPLHYSNDYLYLCDEYDMDKLQWLKLFQPFDLYTKGQKTPDIEALKPYYQSLIDKYTPGILKF